jgi:Flp pilus assembly protein TadD
MQNLFQGHKQQTLEGGVTNTNAFKDTIDRVIHHNQLDERLENLQRANTFSEFNMEKSFNNMRLETYANKFNVPYEIDNHQISIDNVWNSYQNVNQNKNEILYNKPQNHFNQMNVHPNLMYNMQFNQPMMTIPNSIHPSLIEFNKQLMNEEKIKTEEKVENVENKENKGSIFKDIIDVMESQEDERHQKSEFLKFIKKLHTGDIKLNEKDNNIDVVNNDLNQITDSDLKMEDIWQKVDSNLNDLGLDYEDIYDSSEMITQTKSNLFLNDNPFLKASDNNTDLVEIAKSHLNKGEITQAIYALEAEVNNNKDNSEAWYLLGKIHTENDRDDFAMQCFLKSLEADPFNSDALLFLGISCTNEFDEFQAMKYLKSWIKLHHIYSRYLDENNPLLNDALIQNEIDNERDDEDYYTRARRIETLKQNFYLEMGNLMEYIANNEKMADADLWTALGIVHFIPHQYERAIECFRKAVQIDPKDYNSWNKLGAILAHSKMDAEAINTYKKALEINPYYARCWTNLGIAYLNLDNYNESRAAFLRALKVYRDIPNAWSYLNSIAIYSKDVADYELIANRNLEVLLSKYKI